MRFSLSFCAVVVLCAVGAVRLAADEIQFNNGDRLTGKISNVAGGKLTIESAIAGTVVVDLKDVKTFSSDAPIEMHLADGTVIKQKVTAGNAGQVNIAPGGTIQPQAVPIASVATVNPPPVKWTGNISAGLLVSRGNTESENANVSGLAVRRSEDDRFTLQAGYFYGRQRDPATGDKSTTTDNWMAEAKYDYFFAPKWYVFGDVLVQRDRIADLNLRFAPSAGIGYQWVERPDFNFNTEAGLAWFHEEYNNDGTRSHMAARLAYHLDKKLNDQVTLFHNLAFYPSLEDAAQFFGTTDAGIRASLTKAMFTEFKAQYDYDTNPAPGAHHSNVRYIASVGWTF